VILSAKIFRNKNFFLGWVLGAIFCASCEQWEPCKCSPVVRTVPKQNSALLVVRGVLGAARFWVATPSERRAMIDDAIVRFNKINNLRTEQSQNETPQKKVK